MQDMMRDSLATASWADLTEEQPHVTKTMIEQAPISMLPEKQRYWREHGYVVLPKLIPDDVLDAYAEKRAALPQNRQSPTNFWGGWHFPTPYMICPELLDVATYHTLMHELGALLGEYAGVHLALTGWVSTERNWHQDSYLNPYFLWSHYAAAWIALDDVHEDSGPFEFIAGSHLWPTLRQDKLFKHLTPAGRASPHWPTFTQEHVARVCEEEIHGRGMDARVSRFLPTKGDVLIWHSNLLHRGSAPKNPELLRKSLICHYSSIIRRLDMERLKRNPTNGMLYFDLPVDGAVRMA